MDGWSSRRKRERCEDDMRVVTITEEVRTSKVKLARCVWGDLGL
jgi:hypothetical protein